MMNNNREEINEIVNIDFNKLTDEQKEKVKPWIKWTNVFASICGTIKTVNNFLTNILKEKNPELADRISGTLHLLYDAVKDINSAFVYEIKAIETGKSIKIIDEPEEIPEWDHKSISSSLDIVNDIWDVIIPSLKLIIPVVGEISVIADAVMKFINDSHYIIADLEKFIGEAKKEI